MSVQDAGQGRREERKAQNRAKLLAAARKVFAEKGVGEATARDIVRETDLATGTFYNYFKDKEELFAALLQEFEQRVSDATLPLRRDPDLTFQERIEEGARAFFRVVAEDAELFHVLRRNAGAIAILPSETLFTEGMAELAEDLERWRRDGDLGGIDLDYLSAVIAGAAFQVACRMVERDPPDPEGATRFMTGTVLGVIQAVSADMAALEG
ncbi:MAG: TetR/AcrR family transcriptional regulator [Actinomycetota bacterium]|nr:TetR/AcrR family transcriptional regulator [Actinomycetota bacterium]